MALTRRARVAAFLALEAVGVVLAVAGLVFVLGALRDNLSGGTMMWTYLATGVALLLFGLATAVAARRRTRDVILPSRRSPPMGRV